MAYREINAATASTTETIVFFLDIFFNCVAEQPYHPLHDKVDNLLKIHYFFQPNDYRKMQLERQASMIKKK